MSGIAQPNGPADSENQSRSPEQTGPMESPAPEPSGPVTLRPQPSVVDTSAEPAEAVVEPVPEVGTAFESVAEAEAVVEPVPEVGAAFEPVPEVGAAFEPVAEAEAVVEPVAEAEAVVEPVLGAEAVVEPVELVEAEAVVESDPGAEVVVESDPEAEVVVESDPGAEAVVESDPGAEVVVESDPEAEVVVEPDPEVVVESGSEVGVESVEAGAEVVVEPDPEAEVVVEPDPEAEVVVESDPEAEVVAESGSEVGVEPDGRAGAGSEAKPGPEASQLRPPPITPPAPTTPLPPPPASSPPPPTDITLPEPAAPGKIVEGVVTQVSSDSVDLLLDDGRPAVINRRNFGLNNEEPSSVLSVGDRAFGAELAREDPKNRVVLSRVWALKRQAWQKLISQASQGETIRCRVVSTSKKGLVVDAGVRGFVPASHLELDPVHDFEPYMGETLELKILEIDPRREKLVLSRRALLQKALRRERQELMGNLAVGEIRKGRVQSLADYGAFVDLGGVSGLVHLSELSWYRVSKPADVVKVGDEVSVKILDVKVKRRRISLSIRQTESDPLKAIEVGSIMVGEVTRLVDFGAFVLIEGFEGLVHLSELAEYRVSTPEAVVAPGDQVRVKVLSVDPSRRRIELSIRRAAEYQG